MKRSYKTQKQQAQNQTSFALWLSRLHDICLTVFKWEGLPFPVQIYKEVETYLNEILYKGRMAAFFRIAELLEGDAVVTPEGYIPLIAEAVPSNALTWYGGCNDYVLQTKTEVFHGTRAAIALCHATPVNRSLAVIAAHYATLLSQADMSMRVNMINQNTPAIIQSPPGQELTYANMFEQVAGFKPVVYGREGLLGDEKNGLFAYRYLQPAQYVADKLEMLKHDLLNDFFNELGVSAKSIEKKAQLISDELNIDFSSNSVSKNIFLDVRKDFCKQINEIFGLNVTCEFNVDVLNAWRDFQIEVADNVGSGTDAGREGAANGSE